MVEASARELRRPERALAEAIRSAYRSKPYGYVPSPKNWSGGGLWALTPTRAFAWRYAAFGPTATRFAFGVAARGARGRRARAASGPS